MGLEVVLGGGALVCPSFASPACTKEIIRWCAVLLCSSVHSAGPPGSDIGARLRNERIRTERGEESAQVFCRKDREKV